MNLSNGNLQSMAGTILKARLVFMTKILLKTTLLNFLWSKAELGAFQEISFQ